MKLLKTEANQGMFLAEDDTHVAIDKITKEDLLRLVQCVLKADGELDPYDEDVIKNQAHQIVYKSVYRQLYALEGRRQEFLDSSERLYLEDYKKYKGTVSEPEMNSAG